MNIYLFEYRLDATMRCSPTLKKFEIITTVIILDEHRSLYSNLLSKTEMISAGQHDLQIQSLLVFFIGLYELVQQNITNIILKLESIQGTICRILSQRLFSILTASILIHSYLLIYQQICCEIAIIYRRTNRIRSQFILLEYTFQGYRERVQINKYVKMAVPYTSKKNLNYQLS